MPQNFATLIRAAMAIFYATLSGLGGFWLYFFNKASVKAQFREMQLAGQEMPHALQAEAAARPLTGRPLSISIIGWFLLISSALAPLSLLYSQSLFPGLPIPLCFLGFFFFGRSASVIFLTWVAVQIVAAVGLLRLKNWGRVATIALQCLGLANVSLLVLVPTNRTRFQNVMESLAASMNARMPQPAPFVFPMWMGLAAGLPVVAVILWFLITRKQAFVSAGRELPR